MKVLNFVKSVFKKENFTVIMVVIIAVLMALWLQQCNRAGRLKDDLKTEQLKNDQNTAAMNEQIKVVKKLNGDIESSKATYMGSIDDVMKYDSAFAAKLKDQRNLIAGIYSDMSIKLDSIMSRGDKSVKYGDSTYGIKFETTYDKNMLFNKITGETKFGIAKGQVNPIGTSIYSNEMRIGITYGFREDKDKYEVFAVSKSDNVKFDELDGIFTLAKTTPAPVKRRNWCVGPQFGVTYGMRDYKVMPYLGLGVSYNLFSF